MHFLPALSSLVLCTTLSSLVSACPTPHPSFTQHLERRNTAQNATTSSPTAAAALKTILDGNSRFQKNIAASSPGLLLNLTTEGQKPPAIFIGCADSRVSENQIFDAQPGTLFVQRNIANQFSQDDSNANSALMYAVETLGVQHVIVMGHYGCGGIAAATQASSANDAVQKWIQPIRDVYAKSTRTEIVTLRTRLSKRAGDLAVDDPGFMALVEENVKSGVSKVAASSVVTTAWKENKQVFVHGWVYSLTTGAVKDLDVTISPPSASRKRAPQEAVAAAIEQLKARHAHD